MDWWCPGRFDATPVLWRLLDPAGGTARWRGARLATREGWPAGPTAGTVLRVDGRLVDAWDGLIGLGDGTVLIRLVRSHGTPFTMTHELSSGGFEAPFDVWAMDGGLARSGDLTVFGADARTGENGELLHDIAVVPDRWSGIGIVAGTGTAGGAGDLGLDVETLVAMMEDAERREHSFLRKVQLPHDHPSRVVDCLRVLHACTDAATGAPVASVTTSLPEAVGGTRQFDYRYTWLRDSAYAIATAALLGRAGAAVEYLGFISSLVERHGRSLHPLTTTKGDEAPDERTVDGVSGWGGSTPVRIGNGAREQQQLDSISTLIEAISVHIQCGGRMTRSNWALVEQFADTLVDRPFAPSNGLWELRDQRLLVTEELSRWIGLDKAIRLRRLTRPWRRRPRWDAARAETRRRLDGVIDPSTGMLPQSFDGPFVADAATLLAVIHGFVPRHSDAAKRLVHGVIDHLGEGAFLRRYPPTDDGFEGVEGAFLPASWWAVSALVAAGEYDAALARADEMCAALPPLLPEEWSVADASGLGNTPLLWSHTEAARALYNLHVGRIRHRYGRIGAALWRIGRYLRLRLTPQRS